MLKSFKNSKILKNDGHFQIPHPQISLKQFSNICENVVYFFLLCRGLEKWLRIFAKQKIKKKFKMVSLVFLLTFCNYHTLYFQILKNWPTLLSRGAQGTREAGFTVASSWQI